MNNHFRALFTEIMILLPGILFWGGVVAYIIYRSNHPVKRSKAEKIVLRVIGGVFVGCIVAGGIIVLDAMRGSVVNSKVSSANSNARSVNHAFEATVAELDLIDDLPDTCEEIITGEPGGKHDEDSFEGFMDYYFSDHKYYVIVTDGHWNVRYTLWSAEPITPDEIRVYTLDQQRKNMKRLFGRKDLIGYYEPKPKEQQNGNTAPSEQGTTYPDKEDN
jgi:hypothetical protein